MSSLLGSARRWALAPSLSSVGFAGRRFPVVPTASTARLEAVPRAVVCGFEWAVDSPGLWDLERRIALVEPEMRGFAFEGAAMAAVVLDAMSGFRTHRTRDLLAGPARPHLFLSYIGVGFAMARLPRTLWRRVLPDLEGVPHHPTMSWLAVDGCAFDLAYFHTRRWVDEQERLRPHPWLGRADYFPRAADQGIGRALWFVRGGDVREVARAVERFEPGRRADLWAGAGLAAAFAGGAPGAELHVLRRAAGEHWPQLALGAVFAATARTAAGHVPPHTELATRAFGGMGVDSAVALAEATAVGEEASTDVAPAYEVWRSAIRSGVVAQQVRAA